LAAAITGFGQGRKPASLAVDQKDEIGQLTLAFTQMADQVEARNVENQALSENLERQSAQRGELLKRLITAQEDERKRVARELHDELGQALTGLAFKTNAIAGLLNVDRDRAANELEQTQGLIHDTADRMYDLIMALRPSLLDDMGLAVALRAQAERTFQGTGIQYQLQAENLTRRLPPEVEIDLYRIFQEALNNIVRHSGATQVLIRLACADSLFEGEVTDNGVGFDVSAVGKDGDGERGLGLLGMQERIALVCGQLEVDSRPGYGTTLRVQIPL
jgi:signal transduction histidine kinase